MSLILASSSLRRKELLGLITENFSVHVSDVDESAVLAATPQQLVLLLASEKCKAVSEKFPHDTVIGADTVVDVNGTVLGKPESKEQARAMLLAYSGKSHLVHTGICITKNGVQHTFYQTSKVYFNVLRGKEIEEYIGSDEPYDKAGGYGIQGGAAKFISRIEGCYFNIMGLPVAALYEALKKIGEISAKNTNFLLFFIVKKGNKGYNNINVTL